MGDLNWRQSHATHDLYHAIEAGDYPEWELSVQVSITTGPLLRHSLPSMVLAKYGTCQVWYSD
jgi:hypothetical protein